MMRSIVALSAVSAFLVLGAGNASATSGGCFLPEVACEVYADYYFEEFVDLSSDPKICESQCREFKQACLKVCKQTTECLEVAFTGFARGESLECKELEGAERSDCKNGVSEDVSSFHEFLEGERQDCKDCCEDIYLDCLDECTVS
jgi:hypothetical protein